MLTTSSSVRNSNPVLKEIYNQHKSIIEITLMCAWEYVYTCTHVWNKHANELVMNPAVFHLWSNLGTHFMNSAGSFFPQYQLLQSQKLTPGPSPSESWIRGPLEALVPFGLGWPSETPALLQGTQEELSAWPGLHAWRRVFLFCSGNFLTLGLSQKWEGLPWWFSG